MLQARDGSERPIVWRRTTIRDQQSVVIGSVVVFHDVSMRRRAEHELLQAEKLRSIGILAGGIAHDFNNLLTVILGNISLARMQAEGDESLRTRLGEAEQAILEAMGLTKQLLTFSKGGAPVRKPLDVKAVVKTAVQFVCRGTAVRSKFVIGDEIWPVIGDSGQLSQVIHNLVINAIQAMNGKGEVEVGMENVLVDSVLTKALRPGRYVRIWVKDGGVGIPREHMTRIFDPYFSTKAQGSGLGLTVTYSIIKSHHGHIEVESELGKGSTFSIYLPAAEELPEVAREAGEVVKGVGRILLVDDEEEILATTGAMLRELGYEVETARDGQMAVRAYCEAKEKGIGYDVVILDLTVPGGTGGRETLEVLRRYDADVVAIASSGYSNDPVMAQYRSYGFTGVLMKPYTMHELSVAVREAIRSGQRRTGAT
ncbi:MAG: ATP-binding protein [bacterium]|nr:ATP-binding protein [bacterium]